METKLHASLAKVSPGKFYGFMLGHNIVSFLDVTFWTLCLMAHVLAACLLTWLTALPKGSIDLKLESEIDAM